MMLADILPSACAETYRLLVFVPPCWCYCDIRLFCTLTVLSLDMLTQALYLHVTLPRHHHFSYFFVVYGPRSMIIFRTTRLSLTTCIEKHLVTLNTRANHIQKLPLHTLIPIHKES
jgi:hypothetical protein